MQLLRLDRHPDCRQYAGLDPAPATANRTSAPYDVRRLSACSFVVSSGVDSEVASRRIKEAAQIIRAVCLGRMMQNLRISESQNLRISESQNLRISAGLLRTTALCKEFEVQNGFQLSAKFLSKIFTLRNKK
jgi:hypothetical protein